MDLRRISTCTPTQGSRFELEGLSGSLALNMKCTVSWAVFQLKAKCLSFPLKACQISADWTNYRNRDHTVTARRRATAASLPQGSAASQHIKQNTIQKQKENRKVYCLSFKYRFLLQQHTRCLPALLPQPLQRQASSSSKGDNRSNKNRSDKDTGGEELQDAATSHFKETNSFYHQVYLSINKG